MMITVTQGDRIEVISGPHTGKTGVVKFITYARDYPLHVEFDYEDDVNIFADSEVKLLLN